MDACCYAPLPHRLTGFHEQTAIIDEHGTHHSYARLALRSEEIACHLLKGRPDLEEARIAFLVSPGFNYVSVMLGIWKAGGIAVPLGLQYPPAELRYFLTDSDPEAIIVDRLFEKSVRELAREQQISCLSTGQLSSANQVTLPQINDERRAMILYTSGATSQPKGVVTTHRSIGAQVKCLVDAWEWRPEDYALHVLPLHHVHGIINVLSCALWVGAKCEMLPKFEPSRVCESILSGRITTFMAVPTIYVKLIAAWTNWDRNLQERFLESCKRVRLMVSGSAALPVKVAEKWKEISGHTLLERYGMTEIGMALSNPLHGSRRLGSVGSPLPGIEVRLTDEKGEIISEEGVPGEISVRGETVFKEYWRKSEITRNAFREGWFRTGDVALVEDGYYRILGRSSVDIIKTGGYKISALETEEVLLAHEDIRECAVVGVEDEEWGEKVSAVLVLRPGCRMDITELRKWAADRLVKYKIPSQLRVVKELPRNPMGKVRKPELRALFQTTCR